jgi:DNA-binding transcriptional regulator YiaG
MSKSPPVKTPPRSIAGMHYGTALKPEKGTGKSRLVKYSSTLNALRTLAGPQDTPSAPYFLTGSRGRSVLAPRAGEKPSPSERSKPSTAALRLLQAQPALTINAAESPASGLADPSLPKLAAARISDVAALGEVVRIRRQILRLSQQELAARAHVGRRFVSDLEAGKTTAELGKALAVCQALRIVLTAEMNDGG